MGAFGADGSGDAGADVARRADVAREFGMDFAKLSEFVHGRLVDFFLGVKAGAHGPLMDEMEEGKQKFLELVKGTDAAVQVVMPVTPSNSMFLISLTRGPNRKFITISEDDIIDLPNEAGILAKVAKTVKDAVSAL